MYTISQKCEEQKNNSAAVDEISVNLIEHVGYPVTFSTDFILFKNL